MGSLATVAVVWAARELAGPAVPGWWISGGLAALAAVANVSLGSWIERHFRDHDPGAVVLDEVAGQSVALSVTVAAFPVWINYLGAFALFRVFDITKPLGVKRLESLPRGWGILMDDILAGLYAAGVWAAVAAST